MGWADNYIKKLSKGETVKFRPRGHSMSPKVNDRDLVTVAPARNYPDGFKKGDIVLCKVRSSQYLHLVMAVRGDQYQIGNNKGHTNGWTSEVYGKVVNVRSKK